MIQTSVTLCPGLKFRNVMPPGLGRERKLRVGQSRFFQRIDFPPLKPAADSIFVVVLPFKVDSELIQSRPDAFGLLLAPERAEVA